MWKQVRKTNLTHLWYQFKKRVGKSILTFRIKDLVNFFVKGFRSTLNLTLDISRLILETIIHKKVEQKISIRTLADCEWRAAVSGLKPF